MASTEWPSGLKKLQFGSGFNKPIGGTTNLSGLLPDGLQELRFGRKFNQVISHVHPQMHYYCCGMQIPKLPVFFFRWVVCLCSVCIGCFDRENYFKLKMAATRNDFESFLSTRGKR